MFVKIFPPPAFNRREALRYAGVRESDESTEALLNECLRIAEGQWSYQACWEEYPIVRRDDTLDLGFVQIRSSALEINLRDCDRLVLFAATVGNGIDRLLARYTRLSPARAHMLQALGAERIESLCDVLQEEIRRLYGETRPRFSPGFGDVPLALQKDIFQALQCAKHIGVTLGENLLMSPSKSVTALIGIRRKA